MGRILTVSTLGEYLKKLPQDAEVNIPGGRDYYWRVLTDDVIAVEYPFDDEHDEELPECWWPRKKVYLGRSFRPCGCEEE